MNRFLNEISQVCSKAFTCAAALTKFAFLEVKKAPISVMGCVMSAIILHRQSLYHRRTARAFEDIDKRMKSFEYIERSKSN